MKDFKLGENPIAVVGMASLMPDAKELSSFWDNIVERLVSIVDVPEDRWSIDDYYDPDPLTPDKTYCKRGAFIPDIEFNPVEYGLPPNILEVTDVSQLLGLVVAKDVLLDAGIKSEEDYDHDRIGITLGIGGGQKLSAALTARLQYPVIDKVLKNAGVPDKERNIVIEKYKKAFVPWEENSFPGLLGNVIAGRIANRFNFGGMNSVVDAACASSLSAMKMAVNELTLGNSDLMITGGSCTDNSIFMYMSFSKTPAFTPAEFIKPFDADSTGMMVGEGVGMIALKRLEDAERDGDRIYALIKGMGSSSDGRFKSIYAPRPEGQAKALKRAYEQAGFEAKTVGLVEAHGTGTAAGDVAEFNSLRSVFSENNDRKQHVALGSVKSQIGHLKAAAGTAGFMKIALALHHKVLPPTASVTTPNPKLAVEDSPFYINAETRPWLPSEDGSPRRAAVSAFGFGGTNFHFVLEEYTREMQGAVRLKHVDHVSIIESSDVDGLIKQCEGLLEKLKEDANPENYQNFIEETRTRKIAENSSRIGFVSRNAGEAIDMLELAINTLAAKKSEQQWELPQGITFRSSGMDCNGKLVALFPGQGSQYLRMGDALAQDYPEFRDGIGKLDTLFVKDGKQKLSDIIYPIASFNAEDKSAQEKTLQLTQNAQPGIGAFSVGSYKLLQQAGLKPDFVAGHSFGELTALWAAGVFSEDDFYFLAKSRGEAMAAPDDEDFDAGSMMAVSGDIPALEESMKDFPDLKIANFNSNAQVVIAGPSDALKEAQGKLKEQGFKLVALPVSAAFHTPLVAHAQKPFADAIEKVKFSKAEIPVYANGTGKVHGSTPAKIKSALKEHILNSVQFRDEIENIYQDGGRVFLEFGPKNVLGKLTENILKDKDIVTISVNPSPTKSADQQMKLMVAKLAVLGVELDEVDKYAAPFVQHATEKPSPLNIKISAAAFVSEKTRKNFSDSLEDGFKLVSNVSAQPATGAVTESAPVAAPAASGVSVQAEINLEDFYQLQNETLKVHEKYLENPAQYMESFQDLLSRISDILDRNPDYELPETISRSLEMFNVQQQETNKVHEQFLKQQAEASQASLKLMNEHYSLLTGGKIDSFASSTGVAQKPVVTRETRVAEEQLQSPAAQTRSEPVDQIIEQPIEAAQGFDIEGLMNEMLEVVAEKTGYPSEMLELDMDMEADLGIDSIKRVEILGSIQEAHPELPELDPEALAELRTLKQIVDYIEQQVPAGATMAQAVVSQASSPTAAGFDIQALTNEMLEVVAEKTGYPSEMLELDMDMEADLGIDSIKRVEILGSIQEAHPELPELDPEALAELRTLKQIVDYIEQQVPAGATIAQAVVSQASSPTAAGFDIQALTNEMLEVVAEKTGYPSEMLELDMDMEADLGIDSIKRVEILGSIQEAHPELPELDPEALAELRTLRQIVDYIEAQAPASGAVTGTQSAAQSSSAVGSFDIESLTEEMLSVVAEKTGYPSEMLEMGMDMEADLGIDSIKRVEILGSIQEAHPELPELDPEALAELRTLQQIVDYIEAQAPGAATQITPVQVPANQTSVSLDIEVLTQEMLAVVADKTGYPSEMLELDMDMEADLGIDSIKRVEILGAIQEAHPELPELDPEALAEMRSLRQIVSFIEEQASALNPAGSSGGAGNETAELVSLDEYKQKQNSQQKPSGLSPERAKVVLKELAPAEHLLNTVPEDRACIIVSDGTELTASVVKEYHELSWKVALVNLPGTKAVETGNLATVFELKGFEEEELEQCISDIEEKFGKAACFIFLDASYKATINQALKLDEKRTLAMRHLFLFAKHLKQSLEKNDPGCRNAFITVSHLNGKLGFESGKKSGFDPVSGAPFALCKTLRQEWADVFCRALDIAPSMKAQESAQLIVRENNDANATLVEVGLSGDQRTTLEPEIIEAEPAPGNKSEHNIDQDSVFLVSGGAKGVTAQCVLEIAKSHQCRFILLGRSSISDAEPDWAKNSSDESSLKQAAMSWLKENGEKPTPVAVEKLINPILSQREIGQFLETLEKVGSKAIYLSVDVCDQKAIKKSLEQAQKDVGQITGLIHGAGVLADKFIEQKTIEDFNAVFNTKIAGLASLLKALDPKTIKHLVLFSSAAGFFGNPGQSDYAMANEVLNKFALVFSSHFPDCRVYSFNWGPWDGGMVTPQLKKLFESRGVELISIEGGSKLLNHYLSEKVQENQQILVGSSMEADSVKKKSLKFPDKPIRLKKVLNPLTNVFLDDHAIGKQKVLPMVCSISWHVNTAEACFPGFSIDEVSNASVFNGITFNGNQERTFFQELDNFDYDQDTGRLSMKSSIFSEEGGKRVNHYGAELQLLEKHSGIAGGKECLVGEDVKAIAENKGVSAKQYYENGSLFHGKGLQLIESVLEDNNERLLLKATASSYSEVEQGLFRENGMNHFSMDALLQACLVWVRSHKDMPSLPLKISAIKSYGELSPGQSFFIDLKVVSESSVKMICDITCFNESGELIASLEGAEVTISKSLETKFAS